MAERKWKRNPFIKIRLDKERKSLYPIKKGKKMSAIEQLKQIYTKFYNQKEVLTEAPVLSQNPSNIIFDSKKADIELNALISYLMGVPDIQKESFEKVVEIIQKYYDSQPEWKKLLVEYFDYTTQKEKEELQAREDALVKEIEEFTKKLLEQK